MHSDPAEVKKKIRTYLTVFGMLMIFTVLTVTASRFHFGVPVAVTVALIIAAMKGSMVAAVFMHLSAERKWIYGALLLTVVGFIILMSLPSFTIMDSIGTPAPAVGSASVEHPGH
jgi:caa(3)-type oxidase subunit IV